MANIESIAKSDIPRRMYWIWECPKCYKKNERHTEPMMGVILTCHWCDAKFDVV